MLIDNALNNHKQKTEIYNYLTVLECQEIASVYAVMIVLFPIFKKYNGINSCHLQILLNIKPT